MKPDTLSALNGQLAIAGCAAAKSNDYRSAMPPFFNEVLNRPDVSAELMSALFYRPLANTLTLGLYSWLANPGASSVTVGGQ